jgi:hypothetical protein
MIDSASDVRIRFMLEHRVAELRNENVGCFNVHDLELYCFTIVPIVSKGNKLFL